MIQFKGIVTYLSIYCNYASIFKHLLISLGVILLFFSFFAILPAPSTSYALKYQSTAATQIAAFLLTLTPVIVYFNFLLILPAGKTIPAREDIVFALPIAAFPNFPDFPLLLETIAGLESVLGLILPRDDVATSGKGDTVVGTVAGEVVAGFEIVLVRLAVRLTGATIAGGGAKMEVAGGGGLLSNKASGTLEIVRAIDELLQASLPTLSKVSRIVIVGKMLNIFYLYPANLATGLFIKSSCNNCLKLLSCYKCQNFYILFAPNINVCKCLEPLMYCKDYPVISLKTKSKRIKAGK